MPSRNPRRTWAKPTTSCGYLGKTLTRIIAVANQKGGVGKTTTTVNLAAALAALNERVLLVDLDPQGNATMGSGIDKGALAASSYHWLVSEQDFAPVVQTSPAHFDVMPSNIDLTAAEVSLLQHLSLIHI